MTTKEHVRELLILRHQKYAEFSGFALDTVDEEYMTLFCEGDGHVGLYGPALIPRVGFAQDREEREPLDYIASLVPNGYFDGDRHDGALTLTYHGPHCMPFLEMFSRHVVGRRFLERLNPVLSYALLLEAIQHPITLDGVVGFWDSEGTSSNAPYISIAQKDREILDFICEKFGGNVYYINDADSHNWCLCGDEARKLASVFTGKSHCPQKVERLRENFEGPSYHEEHREERLEYHKRHSKEHPEYAQSYYEEHKEEYRERQRKWQEKQKHIREYMKIHLELVKELDEKVH